MCIVDVIGSEFEDMLSCKGVGRQVAKWCSLTMACSKGRAHRAASVFVVICNDVM